MKTEVRKMKGIKELANDLAVKRGIPKTEAADIVIDFVEVMASAIVDDGGVQIKGVMTIEPKLQKGREGTISFGENKGQKWKSEDKYVLSIKTGSGMSAELNK